MSAPNLGRVSGQLADQLAYLNSPAAIAHEIAALEEAIKSGDSSEATATLLKDWRAVKRAQAQLVGKDAEQLPLASEGAVEVADGIAGNLAGGQ
jgi:hypothetical protein